MKLFCGIALLLASIWVLESARNGIEISTHSVGETPTTFHTLPASDGPFVLVAHGFAGSTEMMQGFALPLAHAGYRVLAFDFLGHGDHPVPMSGATDSVDGATRLLLDQTNAVIDSIRNSAQPIAVLGHSMASDILVRVAADRSDIGPIILISGFSNEITADAPDDLLLIAGAWEAGLRAFANTAVHMVRRNTQEGDTAVNGTVYRKAVAAPYSEHVSVLHSRVARAEALSWLDRTYGRTSDVTILPTGWAILGTFAGLVLIGLALARQLPNLAVTVQPLSRRQMAAVVMLPAVFTPLIGSLIQPSVLPVLIADDLALHLAIYGAIQLGMIWFWRVGQWHVSLSTILAVLVWSAVFGFALDRYAADFTPIPSRLLIIAAMLLGTAPFMIADAQITTHAGPLFRGLARAGFFVSLGIAISLNVEELFFLIMVAPVLVLYFVIFGSVGRQVALRAGPLSSGIALGVVLAWALGVSFPLFAA